VAYEAELVIVIRQARPAHPERHVRVRVRGGLHLFGHGVSAPRLQFAAGKKKWSIGKGRSTPLPERPGDVRPTIDQPDNLRIFSFFFFFIFFFLFLFVSLSLFFFVFLFFYSFFFSFFFFFFLFSFFVFCFLFFFV